MARRFGPVGTAVWGSEKFLALENDTHRLGFLYLIACPHGNSVGVFRLPLAYFAVDCNTDTATAETMLADMERVGLIERDEHGQIRIIRWFFNETGAINPSTGSSFCKAFEDYHTVKRGLLRTRALVEMVMATSTKAERWNHGSGQFEKMSDDFTNALVRELKTSPAATLEALRQYPSPEEKTLVAHVVGTACTMVGGAGVGHVWVSKKQKQKKKQKGTQKETRDSDTGNGNARAQNSDAAPVSDATTKGRHTPADVQTVVNGLAAQANAEKR